MSEIRTTIHHLRILKHLDQHATTLFESWSSNLTISETNFCAELLVTQNTPHPRPCSGNSPVRCAYSAHRACPRRADATLVAGARKIGRSAR